MGSIIADIILIVIFIITVFISYKRGLARIVFHFACLFITIIAVLILYKPLTNFVFYNTNLGNSISSHIKSSIGEFIDNNTKEDGLIDPDNTNLSKSIVNTINEYISEARTNSIDDISGFVSEQLSYTVVSAIVIIILFIIIRIGTMFLKEIFYFLTRLPIIKNFDELGGAILGIIRAYIIIYLILAIISLLSPVISNSIIVACIKNSHICSIFYNKDRKSVV